VNKVHEGNQDYVVPEFGAGSLAAKVLENRLRLKADEMGYRLIKSRVRNPDHPAYGRYWVVTLDTGGTIHGGGWNHSVELQDVDPILDEAGPDHNYAKGRYAA
jgi:hypothetical protein